MKTLLANGLSTFFIKAILCFSNGLKTLFKKLPDCSILCNLDFDNFILADESFAKALRNL